MGLLYLLSWAAALVAFVFVTLSLASGLLWVAEMIEEHSRLAKVIGQRAIWAIIGLHVVLYFDSLPPLYLAFSIICHVVYSRNITPRWPLISLSSPIFILSCLLVFVDHFLWFNYFSKESNNVKQRNRSYGYRGSYSKNRGLHGVDKERGFGEIATFFAICIWAIPLFLFLSLSANDHALPTQSKDATTGLNVSTSNMGSRPQRSSLLRRILDPALSLLPSSKRKNPEGIIAPATPKPGSSFFSQQPPLSPGGSMHPYAHPSSPLLNGSDASLQAQSGYMGSLASPGISGSWANVPSGRTSPLPHMAGLTIGTPPPPRSRRVTPKGGAGPKDE